MRGFLEQLVLCHRVSESAFVRVRVLPQLCLLALQDKRMSRSALPSPPPAISLKQEGDSAPLLSPASARGGSGLLRKGSAMTVGGSSSGGGTAGAGGGFGLKEVRNAIGEAQEQLTVLLRQLEDLDPKDDNFDVQREKAMSTA